jgi:uncharacterized surface protein with fasciclin (FAS1) repeats
MSTIRYLLLVLLGWILFPECVREEYIIATSDDVLMGIYFEQESGRFSSFHDMLEMSGTLSFLNAYGTYTCFAPTNEAIEAFLQSKGKNSLTEFTTEELKDLVRYHVIIDTLNSTRFTDGKVVTPTMYGQYLIVNTFFEEGEAKVKINKYAEIEELDIRVANGIVHSIKTVLEPVVVPVAGLIENDPDLSIFTEALKATGFYDTLSLIPDRTLADDEKRWFTVFVHTDSVFQSEGINSLEDLKKRYSNTGNPKDPKDSLNLYIAYHILDNSLKYVGDLITENAHLTMAPLEVITMKLIQDSVLINEDEFRGVIEKGSLVNRPKSDNTAANGVYHFAEANFGIKVRLPYPIYWDVADQPEIRKLPGTFRVPGKSALLQLGQLANITWSANVPIEYVCEAGGVQGDYLVHSDMLIINLRTAVINWIEFTTPLIVKGTYKLWICTRNVDDPNRRPIFQVYFNDVALPNIVATDKSLEKLTDEELLLQGFKRYNYMESDSTFLTDYNGRFASRLAGTIEVPTTGNHKIKFVVINNGDKYLWIDMIHIIPSENDQLWPRVGHDGVLVYKPDWYPLEN